MPSLLQLMEEDHLRLDALLHSAVADRDPEALASFRRVLEIHGQVESELLRLTGMGRSRRLARARSFRRLEELAAAEPVDLPLLAQAFATHLSQVERRIADALAAACTEERLVELGNRYRDLRAERHLRRPAGLAADPGSAQQGPSGWSRPLSA